MFAQPTPLRMETLHVSDTKPAIIRFIRQCPLCSKTVYTKPTQYVNYLRWQNGDYLVDAFPEFNSDEREMLMSGMCNDCWEKTFPEDHELQEDAE